MAAEPAAGGMATRSRRLCLRCLESFEPDTAASSAGQSLCPACSQEPARPPRAAPAASVAEAAASDPAARRLLVEIAEWCRGRAWWARLPLLVYFAYASCMHLSRPNEYRSFFDALNLGIHELGHYLFGAFGQFLTAAGGTIAQCLAPVIGGLMFLRQRDYFGIAVACMWLATNFFEVAVYVADARALQLTLVAPGVGVLPAGDSGCMHDWNAMLGPLGLLRHDLTIAWLFRAAGVGAMGLGLAFGGWLLWMMARTRR